MTVSVSQPQVARSLWIAAKKVGFDKGSGNIAADDVDPLFTMGIALTGAGVALAWLAAALASWLLLPSTKASNVNAGFRCDSIAMGAG